jgi:hypothetical protein
MKLASSAQEVAMKGNRCGGYDAQVTSNQREQSKNDFLFG